MTDSDVGRFTPFFVADRQASLRILAGLRIPSGKTVGLMTHANTPMTFQSDFRRFPCSSPASCPVIGNRPCPFEQNLSRCKNGRRLRDATIKICDSGVFTKSGSQNLDYENLFETYERMGVDYGIIIDVLKDSSATLRSARKAMLAFRAGKRGFKLIGVAQGRSLREYLSCYGELKRIGYTHIAVGGMLQKKVNSARYVYVRNERFLKKVLSAVRRTDRSGWLFALGCYAPGRHTIFLQHRVSGSDYKGWIFQYSGRTVKKGDLRSQHSRFRQVRTFIEQRVLSEPQSHQPAKRLLILGCGKAKLTGRRLLPALHRYDGPTFRLVRSHMQECWPGDGPEILILSAKYGLIEARTLIGYYETRLNPTRARAIASQANKALVDRLRQNGYEEILVNMGAGYRAVLAPAIAFAGQRASVSFAQGRIGERLHATKVWLSLT